MPRVYVTPNDEAQFAAAIARLMDDPARCAEMGRCGRSRVKTELGWHVTSQNLLRAYEFLFERVGLRETGSASVS